MAVAHARDGAPHRTCLEMLNRTHPHPNSVTSQVPICNCGRAPPLSMSGMHTMHKSEAIAARQF